MPKDATKNVDRYKIRGGNLNEFEFTQNQGQVKETTTAGKGAGSKKSVKPAKGATAKKSASKKAAKKK